MGAEWIGRDTSGKASTWVAAFLGGTKKPAACTGFFHCDQVYSAERETLTNADAFRVRIGRSHHEVIAGCAQVAFQVFTTGLANRSPHGEG